MILGTDTEVRKVTGISEIEERDICKFLQGLVYSWCKNNKGWFAMRDLMGGDNFFWEGTPLYVLYEKHKSQGKREQAVQDAGKDAGWLLKKVLFEDKRNFETKKDGLVRQYKWDEDSSY